MSLKEIGGIERLPATIADELQTSGAANKHIRFNDPSFANLAWSEAGVTVERGAASSEDFATLTRALCAVAETGSLLVASGAANPASLSFLPEVHFVTLEQSAIVATFEDAIDIVRSTHGSDLPRTLSFITGASRTGDIGGRIVQGAHGPRRLIVCVI